MDWLPVAELVELFEVVLVNLVLSADNAIVVGIAVAGLPPQSRLRVMTIGIAGATVLRIVFAAFTVQLLEVVGLLLAGGLLLLWICWKLWGELRMGRLSAEAAASGTPKTMMAAVWQIIVADVSMSLDNVLAVAGVARAHLWVLIVGLALSIAFMGLAAALISRLLNRHPWIAYFGLAVILYVALQMIWDGALEVRPFLR
ncbi:MAG TPA: YjbE family putative metal transport protein [Gammaproteobacteria bacterium]|nr:YjbE family putative metal transport protein [Gammaproteobacteria bacterium]